MGRSFVYNSGTSKDEEKEDELPLTFGIFIDGTLNNKDNTEMRNKYSRGENEECQINYSKDNEQLDKADNEIYENIENRDRIKELILKSDKTPAEIKEFNAIPEKDKYLVISHREYLSETAVRLLLGYNTGTESYRNDYTNVARMWQCCEQEDYAIYIPGMGTDKLMRDSPDGYAFGSGQTGIRARVRLACEEIADKIGKKVENISDNTILIQITLDVFGFSRGAAAARNLIYELTLKEGYAVAVEKDIPTGIDWGAFGSSLVPPKEMRTAYVDVDNYEIDDGYLKEHKLPNMGHLGYSLLHRAKLSRGVLNNIKLTVRFVGLYDTVSSYFEKNKVKDHYDDYGRLKDENTIIKLREFSSTHFSNDVKELHLNNLDPQKIQKMVHFTAKDEHRENFALTKIKQIPGKNIEKNFPGVHCDIGGAYVTEKEIVEEIEKIIVVDDDEDFFVDMTVELDALRDKLINQHWYKDKQIEVSLWYETTFPYHRVYRVKGTRGDKIGNPDMYEGLKKEYSYIPLHFMETYARNTIITEIEKCFKEESSKKFPLDDFLKTVESYLEKYAMDETNQVKEWDFIDDEEIKKIENELKEGKGNKNTVNNKSKVINLKKTDGGVRLTEPITVAIHESIDFEKDINSPQQMLKRLRNEYLHWSSDWNLIGMEPNEGRKRQIY